MEQLGVLRWIWTCSGVRAIHKTGATNQIKDNVTCKTTYYFSLKGAVENHG